MGCCCTKSESNHDREERQVDEVLINSSQVENRDGFIDANQPLLMICKKYVMDTLAVIRSLVDNEQEPPLSMIKLHSIADQESGWLLVVKAMVQVIPLTDPLGPAVIALLLDDCPLPSKDTVVNLCKYFRLCKEKAYESDIDPCTHRNFCVVLGCLAEKMAGPSSIALLTSNTLEYLYYQLREDAPPCVILFALIALEKFAQTSENKSKIQRELGKGLGKRLRHLEKMIGSENLFHAQVGFCSQWCLDNLFICKDRLYSYESVDTENLNAMLNNDDVTEYLKISPNGLQARCDASSFESVRCTYQVDDGVWFYEVKVITAGVMQIGWATKDSKFLNHEGIGVGDDEYSVAYDGCRQLIWQNATSVTHNQTPWESGDILGTLLDIPNKKLIFYLNGQPLTVSVNIFFRFASKGFFAAASFMSFQQCEFNFGKKEFAYPPTRVFFKCFNDIGALEPSQRIILPRHIRLQKLRAMSVEEGACTLCFDQKASIKLLPCLHKGFCERCSLVLETCPMCRQFIHERKTVVEDPPSTSTQPEGS